MRLLALGLLLTLATSAVAAAANENLLGPSRLALRGGAKAAMTFRARWSGAVLAPDPSGGGTLRVAGDAGEGDTGTVVLPAASWKRKGQTVRYRDRAGRAGGVREVVLRAGRRGGRLEIVAGAGWPFDLSTRPSRIALSLVVGGQRWCAEFGSGDLTMGKGGLRARALDAPAACPCTGAAASTFAAVLDVFASHGCTSGGCHDAATASGGLDLRPEVAFANLVDRGSSSGTAKRVQPGSKDESLLWQKLAAATRGLPLAIGSPMPAGGLPALSDDELRLVELWIYAGAPESTVVPGTERLLDSCLPAPGPQKIRRPEPPAAGTGVELYGAPWSIPIGSEGEVCYATWYDVDAQVPAEARLPCPDEWGGPTRDCFLWNRTVLTQDPNSHHSILRPYRGAYGVDDPGWGAFTCHGGALAGTACNPVGVGVPAPAGADCGPGGGCAGTVVHTPACIGYGPPDFSEGLTLEDSAAAPSILISTTPYFEDRYAAGVSAVLPTRGVLVTNSHAFNITDQPTTNEQYLQLFFSPPADQRYLVQDLFDARYIFTADVPPFEEREYCATWTAEPGTRLFRLSTHTHKRGRLFRVWGPGIARPCAPSDPTCLPESSPPLLTTVDYADPAQLRFDPPLALDGSVAERTFKYCAIYDNGKTDPTKVRRRSTSPPLSSPCVPSALRCLGGDRQGATCTSDAACGAAGACDACPVLGGATTEDEMFILMGSYYCVEGSPCHHPAR